MFVDEAGEAPPNPPRGQLVTTKGASLAQVFINGCLSALLFNTLLPTPLLAYQLTDLRSDTLDWTLLMARSFVLLLIVALVAYVGLGARYVAALHGVRTKCEIWPLQGCPTCWAPAACIASYNVPLGVPY